MGIFDDALHGLEQGAGDLVNDGAKVVGDGLNAVGLHGAAQWVETEGDKIGYALGGNVGELQLGETSDPKELVHGNAATIRSTAGKLSTFQAGFAEVADGLNRIDTGHWEGAAADAFRAKFAPEPGKWSAAAEAMGKARNALQDYAGTVESAQAQAGNAIDLWNQGQEATKQQARQVLGAARTERNSAAAAATAALRAATNLAPKEPSFLDRLGDDVTDTLGAGQLAGTAFGAGVLTGAADIVKTARSASPFDPWNMNHPAEYVAGLSGTLAGIADMEVNPGQAVKGLLGSGWGSDPFNAFGKLVPNIALAVATDGGGAAADAGEAGVAAGEDAGENAAVNAASRADGDIPGVGDPVDPVTGDVILRQTDVNLPGALPLTIRRVHRSSQRAGRWFGESWASTLDQRLVVMADRILCVLDGGQVLVYRHADLDGAGSTALPVAGPLWPLTRTGEATYTVIDPRRGLTWRFEPHPAYWRYARGMGEFPLTSLRDRPGHVITFTYDDAGQPVSVSHSGGYDVRVTIDGGRVTGLSLGGTPLVSYSYDDAGRLAGITNSGGRPLSLSYDDAGRITKYIEPNGSSYLYTYDPHGRCVRGESPSGAMSASYAYRDGATFWTDATGAVTTYDLDHSARITAIADPLGGVTRYGHDDRGRVVSETDPLGRVTRYAYDASGNLTSVTRPDGETARAVYGQRGEAIELWEPGRSVRYQEFDDLGNRTALTQPDGSVIRYAYDEAGHLAAVTGPDGAVTRVRCDALGLPVSVTGPDGAVTRYERDQFGHVTRITDPAGAATTMTWTAEGKPLTRTFPDGSVESWTWDGNGNLLRHVSPGGAVSEYEYGPFDRVTAATGPDGTVTSFGFDGEMRLTSVTRAGLTWSYEYDARGCLVAETDYNGAVTRYELDAAGQVVRRLNAAGQAVSYAYDALGNVVSAAFSGPGDEDGPAGETLFAYDAAGDLIQASNPAVSLVFERDALGRVTSESCDGRVVRTSYDAAGRVSGRVTPSGTESAWAYDQAGLPASLGAAGQTLQFGYGPDGRERSRALPGGARLIQEWDTLGRLTGQLLTGSGGGPGAPDVLQRRRYSYDPDGYVTGLSDLVTGSRAFGLDTSGRVTSVSGAMAGSGVEWAEQYAYDPLGNIASASWPAAPESRGDWFDATGQGARSVSGTLTRQAGNVRYRHDAAGRVVARTRPRLSRKPETWRYSWDADDRLTSVITPDGSQWRYTYDPFGRRVLKEQVSAAGEVLASTRFTWDGLVLAEQAVASADPSGLLRETVTTWDYAPGSFTPLTQATRTSLRDAPQETVDAEFYSIITDLAGVPTELIAPDGSVAGYQQRTLWGGTFWHPDGASSPLRFPGQYADEETGLCQNGQRYYDPLTATYLSPDPLGLAPSPNPHAYVPNPHVLIDPLGLAADESYGSNFPDLSTSKPQIEAKFKHAPDFGVTEPRGAAGFSSFDKAVNSFVRDPATTRVSGTYRGDPAILNYNPSSRLVVVQSPSGEFISGWRMSAQQLHYVQTVRSLGGG